MTLKKEPPLTPALVCMRNREEILNLHLTRSQSSRNASRFLLSFSAIKSQICAGERERTSRV
jgi:hypothetical protein